VNVETRSWRPWNGSGWGIVPIPDPPSSPEARASGRAIVKKPGLVLADEPTANLDAANSHNVIQIMERLNRELGTTFIFSTHDEKVIQYLRRTVTLEDGRVAGDVVNILDPGQGGTSAPESEATP
jgi:ABC-type glutathione transport system ATPase component